MAVVVCFIPFWWTRILFVLLYSNPTQYQYKYLSCLIIVCICHVGVGDTTIISLHSDISKKQYYDNRIVVAKMIIPH